MTLGNTIEEKRQTYEILKKKCKKLSKIFAVIAAIFGAFLCITVISASENLFLGFLLGAFLLVGMPVGYYLYGHIIYFGYLAISCWFRENNIGSWDVAGAVGTSFLVSYALGGRKAAKKLGAAWIFILILALIIGIFAGLYYYIKIEKEAKKLGFKKSWLQI